MASWNRGTKSLILKCGSQMVRVTVHDQDRNVRTDRIPYDSIKYTFSVMKSKVIGFALAPTPRPSSSYLLQIEVLSRHTRHSRRLKSHW